MCRFQLQKNVSFASASVKKMKICPSNAPNGAGATFEGEKKKNTPSGLCVRINECEDA